MIKQAKNILKNLKGKTILAFHNDADGVCSASIIFKCLKEKPKIKCIEISDKSVKKVFKEKADNFIFVDLAIDQFYKSIPKSKRIIVIDHHPPSHNLNSEKIFHLNSHFIWPNKYISASQICYKICNGEKWIMRIGAVGDAAIKRSTPEEREAVEIINAVSVFEKEDGLEKLLKKIIKCKKIDEFIYDHKLRKYKENLEKIIDKYIEEFLSEKKSNITFFELKTKYSIASILSNKLFEMFPKDTIIIYRRSGKSWKISGRSGKYDLGSIFKKVSKEIGVGGGHKKAAGAKVTDINKFINRLKKEFKL